MELNRKIKQLRLNKGITQETLANALGITAQAVSRWENETTLPDISLLPQISVFFGVSIDELFEFTIESQYERIRNMLLEKAVLTDLEFENTESFLQKQIACDCKNITSIKLLAMLYEHRAKEFEVKAISYAKKALTLGDDSKQMNNILRDAYNCPHPDWNFQNHHELINFYYEHLKIYPNDIRAYHYILSTLIADGRTCEAKILIEKIENYDKAEFIYSFKIRLLRREGKFKEAEKLINEMTSKLADNWYIWSITADFKAEDCNYDEAIICYEKSFKLQSKPRYTDAFEAIAHIYEIKGEYKNAIKSYQRILKLLRTDWNVTFGATVNEYLNKIEELSGIPEK